MQQFFRNLFFALYGYIYMCVGIAMFFRDDSTVFKALDQSTGLILFVLGLYTIFGLLSIDFIEDARRYFCVLAFGKPFCVLFLLFNGVSIWHPIVWSELLFTYVVVSTTPILAITIAPNEKRWQLWLMASQLSHALFGGLFGIAMVLFPKVMLTMLLNSFVSDDHARQGALMGALETTMTVAYSFSGLFQGKEHVAFANFSIVSRLIAAIALTLWGHEYTKTGIWFGVGGALITLWALHLKKLDESRN